MEVRPGYKQTEVGIVPEDWDVKKIDEIGWVTSGKRLPLGSSLVEHPTPHPYIRVTDMRPGTVSLSDIRFVPESVFQTIKRYRIFRDDIFISVAGTLGIVGKVPPDLDGANLTENADRITDITCSRDFLLYVLMSPLIQNAIDSIRTVGAQPKLALTRIRQFAIPLPPSEAEQHTIAAALSAVDALLGGLDRLIAKKRDLKQAAMQQLLTAQTRLPGFDGEWETKRVVEIGTTYGGLTGKKKADFGVGHARYVTFLNVLENVVIDPHQCEPVCVDPGERQNPVHRGDILFNGTSETPDDLAMAAVTRIDEDNLFLNSFCFGFRAHDPSEHLPLFLAYYFRGSPGRHIMRALAQGATRYNMSKSQFMALALSLPPHDEQKAIATVLSDMDAEIAALEARRDKTRDLKQGMMQELLTGRIRLI